MTHNCRHYVNDGNCGMLNQNWTVEVQLVPIPIRTLNDCPILRWLWRWKIPKYWWHELQWIDSIFWIPKEVVSSFLKWLTKDEMLEQRKLSYSCINDEIYESSTVWDGETSCEKDRTRNPLQVKRRWIATILSFCLKSTLKRLNSCCSESLAMPLEH